MLYLIIIYKKMQKSTNKKKILYRKLLLDNKL